jgi:hypothetical protein
MATTQSVPNTLQVIIEQHDTLDNGTQLKGTEDATIGDLLELFASDSHRDMEVYTSDRDKRPIATQITVGTFGQLQTVVRILGLNTLDNTGLTEDREEFVVEYFFD